MNYDAELRIYEPLTALPEAEQALAQRFRSISRNEIELDSLRRAQRRVLNSAGNPFPDPATTPELFRVLRVPVEDSNAGLSEFFCPEEMPLRTYLAIIELEDTYPEDLLELMLPMRLRNRQEQRLLEAGVDLEQQVHTRTVTWQIPASWFCLCGSLDVIDRGVNPFMGSRPYLRRSIPAVLAIERGGQAAAILTRHLPRWDMVDEIVELVHWIQQFHPGSWVELDYGCLAERMWSDTSAEDIQDALAVLSEGNLAGALACYHRFIDRWTRMAEWSMAN